MNCEQYRERISAEPAFEGGTEHLAACPACQAYRDDMRALDKQIHRALLIDVPAIAVPELPESGNIVALRRRRSFSLPTWIAAAAAAAVMAIVGMQTLGGISDRELAAEVLAHVDHDPAALRVTDVPVSDARLRSVVPAGVGDFGSGASLVTYAQSCVVNGKTVPHLVIQGREGPVTIILMPEEKIGGAIDLEGDSVKGVLLPVGSGSIAIIGASDEPLEDIRQEVLNSVSWET